MAARCLANERRRGDGSTCHGTSARQGASGEARAPPVAAAPLARVGAGGPRGSASSCRPLTVMRWYSTWPEVPKLLVYGLAFHACCDAIGHLRPSLRGCDQLTVQRLIRPNDCSSSNYAKDQVICRCYWRHVCHMPYSHGHLSGGRRMEMDISTVNKEYYVSREAQKILHFGPLATEIPWVCITVGVIDRCSLQARFAYSRHAYTGLFCLLTIPCTKRSCHFIICYCCVFILCKTISKAKRIHAGSPCLLPQPVIFFPQAKSGAAHVAYDRCLL